MCHARYEFNEFLWNFILGIKINERRAASFISVRIGTGHSDLSKPGLSHQNV
jgi:hypothetical protein